jgi:hypothetical protein
MITLLILLGLAFACWRWSFAADEVVIAWVRFIGALMWLVLAAMWLVAVLLGGS